MFSKIVVALNDLPENAELATVSTLGDLPAYTSFAIVVDPTAPNAMKEERRRAHRELHERATLLAQEHGVRAKGSIVEEREVQAILHFLKNEGADLLVIWPSSARLLFVPSLEFGLSPRPGSSMQRARCALSAPGQSSEVFQSKWVSLGGFTT
jgi:hypothetical protein